MQVTHYLVSFQRHGAVEIESYLMEVRTEDKEHMKQLIENRLHTMWGSEMAIMQNYSVKEVDIKRPSTPEDIPGFPEN